ncbi:MAG: hypothetical protein M3N08_09125 [Pseudomonadota bacterium]|nr:hypothetical protein [Pseudomonadota bacterium]
MYPSDSVYIDARHVKKRVTLFHLIAMALEVHGVFFALASWLLALNVQHVISQFTRLVYFWSLAVPALGLTYPLNTLLAKLGLIEAPGWMAWPRPWGFALVYVVWIAIFLAMGMLCRKMEERIDNRRRLNGRIPPASAT